MEHIRVGPPGPGQQETVSDHDLQYLILGWLRQVVSLPQFPVDLQGVETDWPEDGSGPESFTMTTKSGLRYTVAITFEGES